MPMSVYGEFSCPYSYLASHRVDALAEVGVEVDWRAVERDPFRPSRRAGVNIGDIEQRLAEVLLSGERLPWRVPAFVPNTEAAVAGYAEAYGAGVAAEVRRVLFAAYWIDGVDIGDPEVLRRRLAGPILRGHSTSLPLRDFGYAVSPSRGPITTGAWRRMRQWRARWAQLNATCTPVLLLDDPDGDLPEGIVAGAAALCRLSDEISRHGAALNPDLPDPTRYTTVPARPAWW